MTDDVLFLTQPGLRASLRFGSSDTTGVWLYFRRHPTPPPLHTQPPKWVPDPLRPEHALPANRFRWFSKFLSAGSWR